MSGKERRRLEVFARVRDGVLTLSEAADLLGMGYRQARRLRQRYMRDGDEGLVHKLRGRRSNRKTADATRLAVLKLYREKYAGFGPTLACEYLAKEKSVVPKAVSHDTLLRWLRGEGLFEKRRKRSKHRSRRERRSRAGELVQMDGSPHDWFEGRGAVCCLMVMVEDATGETHAKFFDAETLAAAFEVFGEYAARHGLPRALYVDRASIYRSDREPTAEELSLDRKPLTQFGRAMKELGVELILANSPQAKGRVERMNRTLQDRLVKAMRLANDGRGITGIAGGNAFLSAGFLSEFNEQFRVVAVDASDAHRPLGAVTNLGEILCVHEDRVVGRDWCVQWCGRVLQIDKGHEGLGLAGRRVTVRERRDGTMDLLWRGKPLTWRDIAERPVTPKERKPVKNNKRYVPPPTHPWKRPGPGVTAAVSSSAPSARPLAALPKGPKKGTVLLR